MKKITSQNLTGFREKISPSMSDIPFHPIELPGVKPLLKEIILLRKELHRIAEIANREEKTSRLIKIRLEKYNPDKLITGIGGYGIAAVFEGKEKGPALVFRCELDALPIPEVNTFTHRSLTNNVSHKCGHDGHMAITCGLAEFISNNRPEKWKIIFLFQPAEETGEGAERMLADTKFKELAPDYLFALHNLPGFPFGTLVIKEGVFTAASVGMIIRLQGATSHAAFPEHGNSPALCIAEIIQVFENNFRQKELFTDFVSITTIYVRLGEIAFGTAPGYAEVMATLRAYNNRDMDILSQKAMEACNVLAEKYRLGIEISWQDRFASTVNDYEAVEIIERGAHRLQIPVQKIQEPFRASEDFGYFTTEYKGAAFGIGAGENHPQLHNADYDFPDALTGPGISLLYTIIDDLLNITHA